jgi:hypothetical protein
MTAPTNKTQLFSVPTRRTKLGETSYGTHPNLESDWQGIKAPLVRHLSHNFAR